MDKGSRINTLAFRGITLAGFHAYKRIAPHGALAYGLGVTSGGWWLVPGMVAGSFGRQKIFLIYFWKTVDSRKSSMLVLFL